MLFELFSKKMLTSSTSLQILSKGVELPRQPPTHPEETEEELTETAEMQDEQGEGLDHVRAGLQKESSGETTPPSERLVPLKGESTESDLEEDDDEDEAIELRECDEEGAPYGQVRNYSFVMLNVLVVTELTLCKNPLSLVTVAMSDKPCRSHTSCSHAVKDTLRSKEVTDNTLTHTMHITQLNVICYETRWIFFILNVFCIYWT